MNHGTETVSEKTKTVSEKIETASEKTKTAEVVEVMSKPTVATVAKDLAELKAKLNEILGLEI